MSESGVLFTLLVYLAMSAATSAEAVGMCRSVATTAGDEDAEELLKEPPGVAVAMATDMGEVVTRVTEEVETLWGDSFCWTAATNQTYQNKGRLMKKAVRFPPHSSLAFK